MYFETGTDPGVSSMEKSRFHFGGNPGISSGNTSLNSIRTGNSSMHYSLLDSMCWIFTTNNLHPFLMHFFACEEDICLIETFFGTP